MRISHVAYDRVHARPTYPNAYFRLAALQQAASAGKIDGQAPRFFALPNIRSQPETIEVDAPALLAGLRKEAVEAVVFSCPIARPDNSPSRWRRSRDGGGRAGHRDGRGERRARRRISSRPPSRRDWFFSVSRWAEPQAGPAPQPRRTRCWRLHCLEIPSLEGGEDVKLVECL